jgi:hypothetical protein
MTWDDSNDIHVWIKFPLSGRTMNPTITLKILANSRVFITYKKGERRVWGFAHCGTGRTALVHWGLTY